jgi:hypothetical protein
MRRRRRIAHVEQPRDGAKPWLELDAVLKERLRVALASKRPATEAELRKLTEESRACSLILGAELERGETRLAELDADPASSLAEMGATFREVSALRRDLGELLSLLEQVEERARATRAAWLAASARSGSAESSQS